MFDPHWTIQFRKSAKKELADISDSNIRKAVAVRIARLEINAFPPGCRKIEGRNNTWRIRVGNYRIV